MAGIQTLVQELYSPKRERRELAIDCVVDVAIETGEFDDARELLRERWGGSDPEPDGELWQRLFDAIRDVTRARGRKRGLRRSIGTGELPEEDEKLARAAIDLVLDAATMYEGPRAFADSLRDATAEQRAIHAIWWTQSEVRNGGFSQFFMNSTAVVWPHFVGGVAAVGAPGMMEAIDIARRAFPRGDVPCDRVTMDQALELVDYEALSRADDAFYELLDVELWPAVGRYIRSRLSAFFELTGR